RDFYQEFLPSVENGDVYPGYWDIVDEAIGSEHGTQGRSLGKLPGTHVLVEDLAAGVTDLSELPPETLVNIDFLKVRTQVQDIVRKLLVNGYVIPDLAINLLIDPSTSAVHVIDVGQLSTHALSSAQVSKLYALWELGSRRTAAQEQEYQSILELANNPSVSEEVRQSLSDIKTMLVDKDQGLDTLFSEIARAEQKSKQEGAIPITGNVIYEAGAIAAIA
ncbi:MAG TPA: hypothetical protein VLJ21_03925, partial [Candidatus Binatia bacterium]|nr:hypothetical protein [Candidatus Binatia bacterium]